MTIQTDYLVVGAGLAGMAFVDALLEHDPQSTTVIVDRRYAPGGHWLDCYPFVRLHLPSHQYGVASTPVGLERIVSHGPGAGRYESASGAELCGYFDQVMQHRLLASGRVRFMPRCEYLADGQEGRVKSLVTGRVESVHVRKRAVDATYQESRVPAESPPPFEVADAARCVPPGALVRLDRRPEGYVIIGGGKTAIDTCLWLLEQGEDPERIRWIRPRDLWLLNRQFYQGGRFVEQVVEGVAVQLEAAAASTDAHAFFEQCESSRVMLRTDRGVRPTMVRGTTCDDSEIERLGRIAQVIRMGHVKRIESDRIVLEGGEIPTSRDQLHVHCAADGVPARPPVPIFRDGRITMQFVRQVTPAFSYALIGLVEASTRDDVEKNRLLPPNAAVSTPLDWIRTMLQTLTMERAWRNEADIETWKRGTRLNISRGIQDVGKTEAGAAIFRRIAASTAPAVESMQRMLSSATAAERRLFWPPSA
jgi:hypothetical protein